MDLFSVTIILFLIMDPIGNISSFLKLLHELTPVQRNKIILREMTIALIAMIAFNFIGEAIFNILKISEITLRLTSGIILFLVGIKILFPTIDSPRANLTIEGEEPFVTPLAIPLIAGPSLLGTIMLFAHLEPNFFILPAAILIAWTFSLLVLLSGTFLNRILTDNGLKAAERLMGMIMILIAIQMTFEGLHHFVQSCR